MQQIDVFNGDADGICSLVMLRKVHPVNPEQQLLVTGVKRDIELVDKITDSQALGRDITVLDISFDKNSVALERVLKSANRVFYCDHHRADQLFTHPRLRTCIDKRADKCTGLLLANVLNAASHADWAIVAAFGDNLDAIATPMAQKAGYSHAQIAHLRELGVLINYNGYGRDVADLHFAPDHLYRSLLEYTAPLDVVEDNTSPFAQLKAGYETDLEQASQATVLADLPSVYAVLLDDAPWARRISGSLGNQLSNQHPDRAVIIFSVNNGDGFTVSLRAPQTNKHGAASLCGAYPSGGGREGAAGINNLPREQQQAFIAQVADFYGA